MTDRKLLTDIVGKFCTAQILKSEAVQGKTANINTAIVIKTVLTD